MTHILTSWKQFYSFVPKSHINNITGSLWAGRQRKQGISVTAFSAKGINE
jgi:hypothetical protein